MARPKPISQVRIAPLLLGAVLCCCACQRPSAGVLTLAPAGMHSTGACEAHPDGTLTMPPGASVDGIAYVDAGTVTITVSASVSALEDQPQIELWFADEQVGSAALPSTELQALPFHVRARISGPTPLRLVYRAAAPAPTLHLEKIVITEP